MKKQKIGRNFAIVIIFFLTISFFIYDGENAVNKIQYVKIAGQNIKVDLASTLEEQARGLSGQSNLSHDEGMLFVFDHPGKYIFWMKDMNFAIDIVWIGEDGMVVYIKKDARPDLYPETYGPGEDKQDAKYVLEVVAGFSEKNNLKEGDRIEFTY